MTETELGSALLPTGCNLVFPHDTALGIPSSPDLTWLKRPVVPDPFDLDDSYGRGDRPNLNQATS